MISLSLKASHLYMAMFILLLCSAFYFLNYYYYFFFRVRDRNCEQGRDSRLHAVWSQMQGLIPQPWDHDLGQNQESDAQLTEPPSYPYAQHFKVNQVD